MSYLVFYDAVCKYPALHIDDKVLIRPDKIFFKFSVL